ncbi:MAG: TolC family protein [Chitinophagaceae bacterium]|nr:TolC family protein [Chitinophagaceae bacterium]
MNRQPFFCVLSLFYFVIGGYAQEKWDLKRCVDYALANNISVKQADLQTRFSALQLEQNKLSQYPNLSFQGNLGYRFGLSENPTTGIFESRNFLNAGMNLVSRLTLFNWFSKKYEIEAAKLSYEADKAQVKKAQDDIALNVAVAYLQALLAKQQVNISVLQVQQTITQLDVTRKQVNVGKLPELNATELEAQLARDSSNLITAQASVQQLLLQLKALLNLDAAIDFDIAAPPVELIPVESLADLQPEQVYNLAVVNLPQQKVNELHLQAARKTVLSARGSMYPAINAGAGLGNSYVNIKFPQYGAGPKLPTGATVLINGAEYDVLAPAFIVVGEKGIPLGRQLRNNFGQSIGLSIDVPIFNGGSLRVNWERSKLNVRQYELNIERDNQTLKQDIYKAYTDAVAAIQRFHANKKGVETAEKAFNFAQKRYNLGLLSTYDIINSQNNLLRARIEMLYAQFDYVFKLKLLEFYKGQGLKL